MTWLAGVPGRALVLALSALALAAVVAVGLAVVGEEDLGAARWAYIPVVMLGPLVAVVAAASGRRRVGWLGAALCWMAVVPTMPFLLYGLTLLVAAALLTLAALMQPSGPLRQR